MFGENKNIKVANQTIATLTAEKAELTKQVDELRKTVEGIDALKADHAAKIEALAKEHDARIKDLETSKNKADESTMKKAVNLVTAMGIPEEQAFKEPVAMEINRESVMAQLEKLPRGSQARTDFYNKNKGIITQPLDSESTIKE